MQVQSKYHQLFYGTWQFDPKVHGKDKRQEYIRQFLKTKQLSRECAQLFIKAYDKAIVTQFIVTSQRCTNTPVEQYLKADPHMIWKFVRERSHIANQ